MLGAVGFGEHNEQGTDREVSLIARKHDGNSKMGTRLAAESSRNWTWNAVYISVATSGPQKVHTNMSPLYSVADVVVVPTAVFAWIFTSWALLAVTPVYVYMVRGLENADFVKEDMDEIARRQGTLLACASQLVGASSAAEESAVSEPLDQAKEHVV